MNTHQSNTNRTFDSWLLLCSMLGGILVAQTSQAQTTDESEIVAGIRTPIMNLLKREDARAIVEKHLPDLVKALDESFEAQEFLGSSDLLELSLDDDHVIGFDENLLEMLKAELEALNG